MDLNLSLPSGPRGGHCLIQVLPGEAGRAGAALLGVRLQLPLVWKGRRGQVCWGRSWARAVGTLVVVTALQGGGGLAGLPGGTSGRGRCPHAGSREGSSHVGLLHSPGRMTPWERGRGAGWGGDGASPGLTLGFTGHCAVGLGARGVGGAIPGMQAQKNPQKTMRRYSHTMTFTLLKRKTQWVLVTSQSLSCAHHHCLVPELFCQLRNPHAQ